MVGRARIAVPVTLILDGLATHGAKTLLDALFAKRILATHKVNRPLKSDAWKVKEPCCDGAKFLAHENMGNTCVTIRKTGGVSAGVSTSAVPAENNAFPPIGER